MLARAARRRLRRDAFRTPTTNAEQLTLPWLCPALLRRSSHEASSSAPTPYDAGAPSPRPRRPSLLPSQPQRRRAVPPSPRNDTRSLATTAELQPVPSPPSYSSFLQLWARESPSPDLPRLPDWNSMEPLRVPDTSTGAPMLVGSGTYGLRGEPLDLYQNLYACLRVGRLDRATIILNRLTTLYKPSAPELVEAHNIYLQTLLETAQQDPRDGSLAHIEDWYHSHMARRDIAPNAQTLVTLIRAVMSLLDGEPQADAIRRYLDLAHQYGAGVVDDINASPDFSDEEWDLLIRLQPEAFDEPPSIEEVHHLHVGTASARKSLVDHGLFSDPLAPIRPVLQKGRGLDSLKAALAVFDTTHSITAADDRAGTEQDKEQARAYARQLRMEQDSIDAAMSRWKHEDEKLQEQGIHGVLSTKPTQTLMYNWYSSFVPGLKKELERTKKVLTEELVENMREDAHSYGAWFERCKPERLAALTIARVVQSCIRGKNEENTALKIASLTISLGSDIQDYLNTDARARRDTFLKKQRRHTRKALVTKLAKTEALPDTPETKAVNMSAQFCKTNIPLAVRTKLGALCLQSLIETARLTNEVEDPATGDQRSVTVPAFHHQISFHKGKKQGFLIPHHTLMEKLRKESVHGIYSVKLPMVVEPKPWSSFEDGGYYTIPQKVVRQKSGDNAQRAYAQSAIEHGDMDKVLAGLDVLGRVPWQINASVLTVMTNVWNSGEGIGSLVAEHTGLVPPEEPPADSNYQVRARWSKQLQTYLNKKSGLHSQRCFQNFQLETARAFVNEKQIFFPHSVDFRGRAYPIPPILNHIGSDIARGLLKFANGKELGTVGLQWLKIHLANLYGYDKASLREREQFAMDNINEIYDSAINPLGGRRWWAKGEDPWQCLACCMELKNAFDSPDPTRYVSQLPVHQDGTCNGLQHYAALGGDHAGARQVNLEPSDRPQDIYTGVAELVNDMVARDAALGVPSAKFIRGYVTRKVVKRTVMTNVYGVTFMGAKAQVEEQLENIFPNFKEQGEIRHLGGVALYVALRIFEALGKIFNGAQEIQYWLGECGERITTSISPEQISKIQKLYEGKPIEPYDPKFKSPKKPTLRALANVKKEIEKFKTGIIWTTPLRMPVVQPYRKDGMQTVKTKIQMITVAKKSQSDVVDKRKQLQAFPPNFIHSLDATHMILSSLKCSEMGLDFAAVHDSFWTHACDIPNLNIILRDAFVRMHSEDIIGRLAAEFSTRHAGYLYRASILHGTTVASKINRWRTEHRKISGQTMRSSSLRQGEATFEEVALEAKRQVLLRSEDAEERQKGHEMVTPTSIWLANRDPQALTSHRLSLMGATTSKSSTNKETEIREKARSAEAQAIHDDAVASEVTQGGDIAASADVDTANDNSSNDNGTDIPLGTAKKPRSLMNTLQVWIPLTFPPVPKKGDWDVSRLRESKYFFS